MPTTFTSQLQPSNSTDALFRAWSKFVFDGLIAGGWVQTADTGQINFATVTKPGAANTMQGYVILRMADSLQASFPVYMKLEFGSGNGGANEPGMLLSLGTGSSGAGGTTNTFLSAYALNNTSNGTGVTSIYSFTSATTSHCAVCLFNNSNTNYTIAFSVERARDVDGAEIGTHLVLLDTGAGGVFKNSQYLVRLGGTQPTAQVTLTAAVCGSTVSAGSHAEYASLSDVGIGLIHPVNGTTNLAYRPKPHILGAILSPSVFTTTDAELVVYVYGEPHTYKKLLTPPGINGNALVNIFAVWLRYE